MRSSSSWSSWPESSAKKAEKCPETCTGASGTRVPEKTRTMLTRPTYWSLLVRTTSATSGPSGSQVTAPALPPLGVKDSWAGCSGGAGKPRTHRSSSSAHPRPSVAHDGEHRVQPGAGHGLLEVLDQEVLVDLLAAEVAIHQRLVLGLLDHRLDQRPAPLVVVGAAQQPGDPGAVGYDDRQHPLAERVPGRPHRRRRSRRGRGRAW